MTAEGRFSGKNCIVTAGAAGIGKAVVRGLARGGGRVLLVDLPESSGQDIALAFRAEGLSVEFAAADVTDLSQVDAMVAGAVDMFGGVDVLVNNAGGGAVQFDGIDMAIDDWDYVFNLNLRSAWRAMVAVIPLMKRAGSGAIVNVSTMGAYMHTPLHSPAYVASKAGLIRLTEVAAARLAADNIRVNATAPGRTLTERTQAAMTPQKLATAIATESALPRLATVDDQAAAILFLCSDDSAYITGETIRVDGGWMTK